MKEFVKKLIGRLEEYQNQLDTDMWARECDNWYGQLCNGKSEGVDEIIEIVNQLAEEYNNGWIPCSERLPEKDMWCLATFESGNVDKIQYLVTNNWGWNGEIGDNRVIAWQPLPEPYQKGE